MTSSDIRCERCHKLERECRCAEGPWTKEMVAWDRYVCNDMNSESDDSLDQELPDEIDWQLIE